MAPSAAITPRCSAGSGGSTGGGADAGLIPLSAFESYDQADAGDPDEDPAPPAEPPPVGWFPAADGLAAIQALIAHLSANAGAIAGQAEVMEELEQVAGELADAQRAGVRFRFEVVP